MTYTQTVEYSPQERAVILVRFIDSAQEFTTRQVADHTELTRQGAWAMLTRLGRVLNIYYDPQSGTWRHCEL